VKSNGQCSAARNVTVDLASHWSCIIDCGISTHGLSGLRKGDEHSTYTPTEACHPFAFTCYKIIMNTGALQ